MSNELPAKARGIRGNANASPAVIGFALVALLAFVGWLAWFNLFKPPGPPPFSAQELKNRSTLAALAQKCKGDFSKLSPEDQAVARKVAGGMAGRAISMLYKNPDM